jgi:hypothetical protein
MSFMSSSRRYALIFRSDSRKPAYSSLYAKFFCTLPPISGIGVQSRSKTEFDSDQLSRDFIYEEMG